MERHDRRHAGTGSHVAGCRLLQTRRRRRRVVGVGGALRRAARPTPTAAASRRDTSTRPQLPRAAVPSQPPLNCSVTRFFTRDEARDGGRDHRAPDSRVDATTRARARPACRPTSTRSSRASTSFATPTYFHAAVREARQGRPPGPQPATRRSSSTRTSCPATGSRSSLDPAGLVPRWPRRRSTTSRRKQHGVRSSSSSRPASRTRLLGDLEDGKVPGFKKPTEGGFFKMLLEDIYEGMFSDPVYGGNRDLAGWKLVGYPGAQRAYTRARADARPAAQARSRVCATCRR